MDVLSIGLGGLLLVLALPPFLDWFFSLAPVQNRKGRHEYAAAAHHR
jgi:hypothetical protein